MPEGVIVKALSGYYYVLPAQAEAEPIQCRARGIFKKKGITPLVGDRVMYEVTENGEGTVDVVLPRTTELIRPPVANVDQAVLAFSLAEPALNLQLLDKFLVHTEKAGLETLICLTKRDLLTEDGLLDDRSQEQPALDEVKRLYEGIGYTVLVTSTRTKEGIAEARSRLADRTSVFSGQSGVGKSSLVNALVPGLSLETNEISSKLGRGKHTTRHVELIALEGNGGGLVADTPGFSQLDFLQIEVDELSSCFVEMKRASSGCKFRGCLHQHEPGCRVLAAVENGEIASSRYKHYLVFLQEMKERKRRY
ncbi:ribosome small subunit-dependent GTPase A [Paenibacillus hemerocallicola]|uniref:Small ribosomal subunit biogenesis GTPase RsgA n=1 Tax=Paenibacillus hemerocallicola TaxID=1172614 RepID=A0A5C4TFL5_9BACL|nr:ribosome small subunit-dependent GTPase A [Paenibacillus hemerocallicola]TNJ67219.1 ribosome small subunit-dependent GTPase A [Paenibacillus hemerocallicola]